jgi:hypothetical protein
VWASNPSRKAVLENGDYYVKTPTQHWEVSYCTCSCSMCAHGAHAIALSTLMAPMSIRYLPPCMPRARAGVAPHAPLYSDRDSAAAAGGLVTVYVVLYYRYLFLCRVLTLPPLETPCSRKSNVRTGVE